MLHFIVHLFDTDGFVARAHCGRSWTRELITVAQIANVVILLAYLWMPISLIRLWKKRHFDLPKWNIFRLFIYFAIFCGTATVSEILIFYVPVNRFYIVLRYMCATSVSVLAYQLSMSIDYLIRMPSVVALDVLNKSLKVEIETRVKAEHLLVKRNEMLLAVIERLNHVLETELWLHDKKRAIDELTSIMTILERNSIDPKVRSRDVTD